MKVQKLTGEQISYLQSRFSLNLGEIDFTLNQTHVMRPSGAHLQDETVCKMLGIDKDSPAVEQDGKWVKVKF